MRVDEDGIHLIPQVMINRRQLQQWQADEETKADLEADE